MKEQFLHYIWKNRLFEQQNITTFHGDFIEILKNGRLNFDAGPDFLESEIVIGDKLWAGSVEIHVNSSDWNLHQHNGNNAYQNVILHVVWNHDCEITELRQRNVQTLVLEDYVSKEVVYNYEAIINTKFDDIYCRKFIPDIDLTQFNFWFERLLIERFEEKTEQITEILKQNNNNWEETLFKLLAKNFGQKVNVESFEIWSNSFQFSVLQKIQFNQTKVEALFFGQAGFLVENNEDDYYKTLKEEYIFLNTKYNLQAVDVSLFKFSKMRPIGFPTIRLAQLAAIYRQRNRLFSEIIELKNLKNYHLFFEKFKLNQFWETHYTFGTASKSLSKNLTKNKINNLLINTILPIHYAYNRIKNEVDIDYYLDLLDEMKPEKNAVLDEYEEIGFVNKSSKDSQLLIHLKKRYCSEKKCLNCAIGHHILR
jgi:hypothetical protein